MVKISTAEELKAFRDDVNSGNTYEGKYVYLTNDITLNSSEEWEPIGKDSSGQGLSRAFSGIFDGIMQSYDRRRNENFSFNIRRCIWKRCRKYKSRLSNIKLAVIMWKYYIEKSLLTKKLIYKNLSFYFLFGILIINVLTKKIATQKGID